MKNFFLLILAIVFFYLPINAQDFLPYYSPKALVSQTIGYTDVTITYCRPGVKERIVWGSLVPFNKVWRTGANEATTISFTTDVVVEGRDIPAGRYSLFTIPTEKEWTVILNKIDNQWGAFKYDSQEDILRFNVKPTNSDYMERLIFSIPVLNDSSCVVALQWEKLQIAFNVKINFAQQVYIKIKDAIAKSSSNDFSVYVVGARFAADYGVYLNDAFGWIDKAISIEKNFTCYFQKARLYYVSGKYVDALKEIGRCRDAGRNDSDYPSHLAEIDMLEQRIKSKL
jgi:hypothetical protein